MAEQAAALAGRTAIVTGGAGGLGCAAASALARDGASVTLMGRSADALARARARVSAEAASGAEVRTAPGDALDIADLERALDVAVGASASGGLDVFVATVGGGDVRPLMQHDPDSFNADLRLNIVSVFMAIRYGAPRMQAAGGGSIVCVSSTAAVLPCDTRQDSTRREHQSIIATR